MCQPTVWRAGSYSNRIAGASASCTSWTVLATEPVRAVEAHDANEKVAVFGPKGMNPIRAFILEGAMKASADMGVAVWVQNQCRSAARIPHGMSRICICEPIALHLMDMVVSSKSALKFRDEVGRISKAENYCALYNVTMILLYLWARAAFRVRALWGHVLGTYRLHLLNALMLVGERVKRLWDTVLMAIIAFIVPMSTVGGATFGHQNDLDRHD
eukprot:62546-Chlamydomonas_euryale.AAC.2